MIPEGPVFGDSVLWSQDSQLLRSQLGWPEGRLVAEDCEVSAAPASVTCLNPSLTCCYTCSLPGLEVRS